MKETRSNHSYVFAFSNASNMELVFAKKVRIFKAFEANNNGNGD